MKREAAMVILRSVVGALQRLTGEGLGGRINLVMTPRAVALLCELGGEREVIAHPASPGDVIESASIVVDGVRIHAQCTRPATDRVAA